MSFIDTFAAKGCLTLPGLFDPALIAAAHREYERQLETYTSGLPEHLKVGERRVQWPIQLSGPLLDPALFANPLLLGILTRLLGPDMLIDNFTCVTAFPGAAQAHFHADHPNLFPADGGPADPPFAITAVVPLIHLTPETGTTEIFPGSHHAELGHDGKPLKKFDSELPFVEAGGCFLMDNRLWHRGMPNISDRARPVLYIVYARYWFTDILNFRSHCRINLSLDDARALPVAQRRLFRRLAAKGAYDINECDLVPPGDASDGQAADQAKEDFE